MNRTENNRPTRNRLSVSTFRSYNEVDKLEVRLIWLAHKSSSTFEVIILLLKAHFVLELRLEYAILKIAKNNRPRRSTIHLILIEAKSLTDKSLLEVVWNVRQPRRQTYKCKNIEKNMTPLTILSHEDD